MLSGLHRRAQTLAQVARDNDAVVGRNKGRARQPFLDQGELGFGLMHLRAQHPHGRAVGLRLSHLVAARELLALRHPA